MIPTLIKQPFDDPEWIYELKWDGYRAVAEILNQVDLYSRNNYSFNERFPAVRDSLGKIKHDCILDGEIVLLDDNGKSNFDKIRNFWRTRKGYPVFYVFDILTYKKKSLLDKPLIYRKELLKDVLPDLPNVKYVDYVEECGIQFFGLCRKQELEGIVAKRRDSRYVPGIRTNNWLKIKTSRKITAVVAGHINGYLIVCEEIETGFRYIGCVRYGLRKADYKLLTEFQPVRFDEVKIERLPQQYNGAVFIRPGLKCEVEFLEWQGDGTVRHASVNRLIV